MTLSTVYKKLVNSLKRATSTGGEHLPSLQIVIPLKTLARDERVHWKEVKPDTQQELVDGIQQFRKTVDIL